MQATRNTTTSMLGMGAGGWALFAAASIAWAGIAIQLITLPDTGPVPSPTRLALVIVLIGVAAGVANIGYVTRRGSLLGQWLLIGTQISVGLIGLFLTALNTPALMLVIAMAQVPARSGPALIGVIFGITNVVLIGVLLKTASTTAQALVAWFLFLGFQLFALTVAVAQQREKQARELLEAANAELLATRGLVANSARIEERLRVSRELHDIAGHTLTAIKVRLEAHSQKAPDDLKESLAATRDLAQELLDDVRAVVSHLREHDPIRIEDALQSLVERFADARIHLSIDEALKLDRSDHGATILRCVQEAITNAIRHGAASNIWITLRDDGAAVRLTVRDDGTGGIDYERGNGLRGMQERLAALGGTLSIAPSAAEGWTLKVSIPNIDRVLDQSEQ